MFRMFFLIIAFALFPNSAYAANDYSIWSYGLNSNLTDQDGVDKFAQRLDDLEARNVQTLVTDYKSFNLLIDAGLDIDYYILVNGNRTFLFPENATGSICDLGTSKYVCLYRYVQEHGNKIKGFIFNEPFVVGSNQPVPMTASGVENVANYYKTMMINTGFAEPEIVVIYSSLTGPGAGSHAIAPNLTDSNLAPLSSVDTIGIDPYVKFATNLTIANRAQLASQVQHAADKAQLYGKNLFLVLQGHKVNKGAAIPGPDYVIPTAPEMCEMVEIADGIAKQYSWGKEVRFNFYRWRLFKEWTKNVATNTEAICANLGYTIGDN